MVVIERRQRTREQTRAGILQTAKEIARREGWHAVSIRKIADAIEYSAPVVYDYFDSKDRLLDEIRNEGFRHLRDEYERLVKLYRDPEKLLYEISIIHWQFAMQHPELYQVMYNLNGANCQVSLDESDEMRSVNEIVCRIIFSFIPKSAESIRRLYFEWWATSHGLINLGLLLRHQQPLDTSEQIYRESLRRFIRNLR
jgi:AcrR family transcriptional regulator